MKYRCKKCGLDFKNKAKAMWHACFQSDIEEISEAESFLVRLWKVLKGSGSLVKNT